MDRPHTLVQCQYGYGTLLVLAFKYGASCQYWYWYCTLVQYQYAHGPLPVLAFQHCARTGTGIFALWFSTGMGTVYYWYWHSIGPILVLANMYLESVPVWAHSITETGIQLCPYQCWHFCTLGQYQYGQIPLLVLTINDDHTGIGVYAFWSSTSIGMVQYRYWN